MSLFDEVPGKYSFLACDMVATYVDNRASSDPGKPEMWQCM
ncbi:hypothetical protein [Methylomagnum ishizawai]|nr:hypothetical protein [Methylomagnum ishizawai]